MEELQIKYLMDLIIEHGRDSEIGIKAAAELEKSIKDMCK